MKFIVILALCIATVLAAPPAKQSKRASATDDSSNAQILKYENDNIGIDGYNFA